MTFLKTIFFLPFLVGTTLLAAAELKLSDGEISEVRNPSLIYQEYIRANQDLPCFGLWYTKPENAAPKLSIEISQEAAQQQNIRWAHKMISASEAGEPKWLLEISDGIEQQQSAHVKRRIFTDGGTARSNRATQLLAADFLMEMLPSFLQSPNQEKPICDKLIAQINGLLSPCNIPDPSAPPLTTREHTITLKGILWAVAYYISSKDEEIRLEVKNEALSHGDKVSFLPESQKIYPFHFWQNTYFPEIYQPKQIHPDVLRKKVKIALDRRAVVAALATYHIRNQESPEIIQSQSWIEPEHFANLQVEVTSLIYREEPLRTMFMSLCSLDSPLAKSPGLNQPSNLSENLSPLFAEEVSIPPNLSLARRWCKENRRGICMVSTGAALISTFIGVLWGLKP